MKNGITAMAHQLKAMGIEPAVIGMVRDSFKHAMAPEINKYTLKKLRTVTAEHHKAVLVLSPSGGYSVFSPDGHAALCASAKKNKPWVASAQKRNKAH